MPWGIAAAAVGVAGGIYTQGKAEDAAKDASRATGATSAEEVARQEEATARARAGLQPYADQEGMARNQMMMQLGLAQPGSGSNVVAGPGSGYPMGAGMVPMGGPAVTSAAERAESQSATGREGAEFQRFMQDMLGDQIAVAENAGYSPAKAIAEGARRAEGFLQSLKRSGDLPADYNTPSLDQLVEAGNTMSQSNQGNFSSYGRGEDGNFYQGTGPASLEAVKWRLQSHGGAEQVLPQYFAGTPGDQQNVVGVNPDGSPKLGIPTPGGGAQMGGPGGGVPGSSPVGGGGGIQDIQSIMQRAGASGMPEGFQDQYYEDVSAETPNFGMGYEDNPAYKAMIAETMENVNQGAATSGGLYSGARGKALQEASAATQMNFYRDLADREQRGHEMDLARRGDLMTAGQGREDQYYTNYMNLLGDMSSPTTATNIANLETGNAANITDIRTGATQSQNRTNLAGAAASNAATADIVGGIGTALTNPGFQGAWMGSGGGGGGTYSGSGTVAPSEYGSLGIGL